MIEIAGDKDAIATLNLQEIKSFLFNNYVSYKSHSPLAYKKVFINFNYDDQIHQLSPNDEILVYELQERVQVQPNFNLYSLPNKSFYSLYERLYYRGDLKRSLLDFVDSVSLFSSKGISKVSVNKLVLLHGPPTNIGTGKTSLAKAIAQKISISRNAVLVEIKTNSLLSKFYSESSKLPTPVCGYEVESLTAARKTAVCGLEPSDAIRVVNTILTQIDKLQTKSNVLVIATSNITEAIDEAFLDRADLTLRIDNPSSEAIYQILYDGLRELHDKELIIDMVCNCDELWDISKELERKNTRESKNLKLCTRNI
ncbi:Pachytene checkpoint protein 2 [Boothiomyces macroporosus]|uniref:Pachytene checkpoint protein 2 n=1 Tax=Boothiomyces macroporosus TaxID=261099 RepID=A0AAD5UGP4_9FUNG|nr:Pachytene checkpoint protein 2 [Boothiomyces macroporosus]